MRHSPFPLSRPAGVSIRRLLAAPPFAPVALALPLLALLLAVGPARAAIEIGTTITVVNEVRAKSLDRQLKLGDRVVYQEEVSTGKDSAVDIRLIDESTLIMGEMSELILDRMVYDPNRGVVEGALEIAIGVFRFSSSGVKMDLNITTPAMTIGVRGTKFDVLSEDAGTEVAVLEGTVEVTLPAGTESVSAGQTYRASAAGVAGFQAEPSPKMKRAVSTMLALVAQGDSGAEPSPNKDAAQTGAKAGAQTASLGPSPSAALNQAIAGKDPENLVYMDVGGGRMVIELRPDLAPNHVSRIKELARQGFYDGLGFHFVRRGYVAETGDPTGTGRGGSGVTLQAEFSDVPFERGVVGMSRGRDDPDSADSQFFIALGRAPALDGNYTVIGRVVHGIELADGFTAGRPPKDPARIVHFRIAADAKK